MSYPVPADPAQYHRGGFDFVGCNRLVCPECGAEVKHLDRAHGQDGTTSHVAELYRSPDPRSLPYVGTRESFRLYFCRCQWADVSATMVKSAADADDVLTPGPTWVCAGHPVV
jgi:hypothetical protein